MRALRFHGPRDVRIEDVPEPVVPAGWALVRPTWVGICGTDLHEYQAGPVYMPADSVPLTLGHEFCGEIVTPPAGSNLQVGDRVAVDNVVRCGACWYCEHAQYHLCDALEVIGLGRDGALADLVAVPSYGLHKLPDNIPEEVGALVEAFSCGVHTIGSGSLRVGETVAIVGAGPMGLMVAAAAAAVGADKVISIEMSAARRAKALAVGATHVLDPADGDVVEQVREFTGGRGVDLGVEAVGAQEPLRTAISATRKGGRIVVTGIFELDATLNVNDLVYTERSLIGSLSYLFDHPRAIALLATGKVDLSPLITGRVPLAHTTSAYEQLIADKDRHVKIVVNPRA